MIRKKYSFALLVFLSFLIFILLTWDFFYSKFFLEPKFEELKNSNILFITIDGLNSDYFDESLLPEELTRNRLYFKNCISPAFGELSFYVSLFTSKYPFHHGIYDNLFGSLKGKLPQINFLKKRNYTTAAFISNIFLAGFTGLSESFDFYYDVFKVEKRKIKRIFINAQYTTNNVLPWLKRIKKNPFFVWVNYSDLENLILDEKKESLLEIQNKYKKKLYEIEKNIVRIINFLGEEKLLEDTIVVIASSRSTPLRKGNIYPSFVDPDSVKAPFFVYLTKLKKPRKTTITKEVSSLDILPTIVSILTGESGKSFDGINLKKVLYGMKPSQKRAIFSFNYYPKYHLEGELEIFYSNGKESFIKEFNGNTFRLKRDKYERISKKNLSNKIDKLTTAGFKKPKKMEIAKIKRPVIKRFSEIGLLPPLIFKLNKSYSKKELSGFILARKYFFAKKFEESFKYIRNSSLMEADYLKVLIFFKEKNYQKALEVLKGLVMKFPYNELLLSMVKEAFEKTGKIDEGILFFEKLADTYENNFLAYNQLGDLYIFKNDLKTAKNYFNTSISIAPLNFYSYFRLGVVEVKNGNYNSAKEYLLKSLELEKNAEDIYYYLGIVKEKEGNYKKALKYYKKEVNLFPENIKVYFNLANIYKNFKQYEKEIYYLKLVLNFKPDSVEPYFDLARAYLTLQRNLSETVSLVLRGIQNCKDTKMLPDGYNLLSDIYKYLGDNKKARYYKKLAQKIKKYGLSKSPVF